MPENAIDFFSVFEILAKHDVEFIITGGVSAVLMGAPVTTFDLDIIHHRTEKNIDNLLLALEELDAHYRLRQDIKIKPQKEALCGNGHHLLLTTCGPLDIMGTVGHGLSYSDILPETEKIEIETHILLVQSLTSLIALKRRLGRAKDLATIPILQQTIDQQEKKGTGI